MDFPSTVMVGIDLGTSTSEVAILKHGKPMLIRDVFGSRRGVLPSVVAILQSRERGVGEPAETTFHAKGPPFAVAEVKRLMGTDQQVLLGNEQYRPQEISAMILRHLKTEAEKYIGSEVREAIITVPAYFNDLQRSATRDAAEIAGLSVRRLVNEPTAAALAYGIEQPGVEEKVLVYDLGGGTLDVTVLELSEGILDVLATTGNSELGGKEFDDRMMEFLREECRRHTGVDLASNARFKSRLKGAAKKAKEDLSSSLTATVLLDNISVTPAGDPVDFEYTMTRARFEDLIRDLVESTRVQLDDALGAKDVRPQEIDTILMVGGSTRIPLVREFVRGYFGGKSLRTEIDPDEAVALGAAVLSGMESRLISPDTMVITDVCSWTFGVAVISERDGQLVSDVFSPIIRKNSTIPRTETGAYATSYDGQDKVQIRIYQGDAPLCQDNTKIGEVLLESVPHGPAGQEIEVEMSYNLSNEIEVVARVPRTQAEVRSRFRPDGVRLSDAEKDRARQRIGTDYASTQERPPVLSKPLTTAPDPDAWKKSPLYGQVAALISHIDKRISSLEPATRIRVGRIMDQLKTALRAEDATAVTKMEDELTNILFELD